jgi:hypothetical protein
MGWKGMQMAQLLTFAAVLLAGTTGYSLAYYAPGTKERRAARTAVFSKITEVESLVARQRQAGPPALDDDCADPAQLDARLAELESLSLLAGISRAAVTTYAAACRLYQHSESVELVTLAAGQQADEMLRASPSASGLHQQARSQLGKTAEALAQMRSAADRIQDAALELLGKAIWRPARFSTAQLGLPRLGRAIDELNRQQRQLEKTSGDLQDALETTMAASPA